MSEAVFLRRFHPEDAEPVQRLMYPDMTVNEAERLIAEWEKPEFEGRYFEMLAVICGERIAGSASVTGRGKATASLGIELFEDERGKGIASKAMPLLMRLAAEKGYSVILDQVRKDNAASIALHERLGFESDGYVYVNKRGREVLIFVKPI